MPSKKNHGPVTPAEPRTLTLHIKLTRERSRLMLVLEDHYGLPPNALAATAINDWLDHKLAALPRVELHRAI